ncbi:EAL domain-containing protein [Candidatus Frankia alpina]|uniref:EAL domain-containing protein n=1 Tax=Candidatus Frankia alpina TaxID=2699483 RepID=A0A4S5EK59_9ACTN|nr:EAL domain-containing protein [Candidatus Frankia alpina]THJ72230.1 EAL domain-containing protein [Candidatus Frankia alpina]
MTVRTATLLGPTAEVPTPSAAVVELLAVLRRHLHMDTAWLGRIEGDLLVIQAISGDGDRFHLTQGSTVRRRRGLYPGVLSGRLPTLIPDTLADPRTADSPTVRELDIRSYVAAPVVTDDGTIYGLLGCLGRRPHRELRERDAQFMLMLAEILRDSVSDLHRMWQAHSQVWLDVSRLIDQGGPTLAFQPVFDLERARIVGVEALSRFPDPCRSTEQWFVAADAVGLTVELELAAVRRALGALPRIPAHIGLAVNASATTLSAGLVEMITGTDADRLLVEITEHQRIADVPEVTRDLDRLRRLGVRFAADDVGAGYSGLEQLVLLRPEIIKMDCSLTQGIDTDPARRAVATGLVHVAEEIGGGGVIAEGIETAGELLTTRDAGIRYGQGFLLGSPTPVLRDACVAADE